MATSREVPGWYDESHYYLVVAGPVESSRDGQVHHITAGTLAGLYGLSTQLPNVVLCPSAAQAMEYQRTLQLRRANQVDISGQTPQPLVIHFLYPESTGDYSMPQDVRMWQARQRRARAEGSVSTGASALARSLHDRRVVAPTQRDITVNIISQGAGAHPGIDEDRAQAMRLLIANLVREGVPGVNRAADSMRRFAEAVRGVSPIAAAVANLRAIAQPEAVSGLEVEVSRANPNPYAPTPVSEETAQAWVKASTVPQEGSRAWIRIVKKGCVGERGISGDFDCNDYEWGCDHCPVVVDRMNRESALEKSIKGNRMHRFWRAKAKAKNEIDCKSSTMVGIDPASPGSDRTVMVVRGRRAGLATIAKRYRKG